jgi:uncharacterized protein YcfJ
MKLIPVILLFMSCSVFSAQYPVVSSEPVYYDVQDCVDVTNESNKPNTTGAIVGGVAGAAAGHVVGKLLFGKTGSSLGTLAGGATGGIIGANTGNTEKHKQCTTTQKIKGYKNYYVKDGVNQVYLSNEPILVVND